QGDLWGTLARTFSLSLIKYNFFGDQNWRHNYPPYPILDPFVGTFFLAGFLFTLWQTITLIGRRIRNKERDPRLIIGSFLLGSFFVMLSPEFFTGEGLPHALRSIGTQMPVFLMATLPALWVFKKAFRSQRGTRIAFFSILIIALGLSALFNLTKYFVFFANNPAAAGSFNENYTNMGRYLLSLPPEMKKYVLFDEKGNDNYFNLPVYAHPVYFLTRGRVTNMEIIKRDTIIRGPAIFLMVNYNEDIAKKIEKLSPGAQVKLIDPNGPNRTGGDFNIIILPETNK
ncbi:MAG: hypothetical protein WCG73_01050, partial [Candidatus Moraniibacteriota bacterium]